MIAIGKFAEVVKNDGAKLLQEVSDFKNSTKELVSSLNEGLWGKERELSEAKDILKAENLKAFRIKLEKGVRFEEAIEVSQTYKTGNSQVVGITIISFNKSGKRVTLELIQNGSRWDDETETYEPTQYIQNIEILTSKMNEQILFWMDQESK
jgi:hypothetical protein